MFNTGMGTKLSAILSLELTLSISQRRSTAPARLLPLQDFLTPDTIGILEALRRSGLISPQPYLEDNRLDPYNLCERTLSASEV